MPLRKPEDRKLRAMLTVQKIVGQGKTQKEAAKELGISVDTVQRDMDYARKASIYVEYEQRLYEDLVPLAFNAVKMGLEDGDSDLGLKILQATNIAKTKQSNTTAEQQQEEELYGEIARLRSGLVINVTPAIEPPRTTERVVSNDLPRGPLHGAEEAETAEEQTGSEDVISEDEGE